MLNATEYHICNCIVIVCEKEKKENNIFCVSIHFYTSVVFNKIIYFEKSPWECDTNACFYSFPYYNHMFTQVSVNS